MNYKVAVIYLGIIGVCFIVHSTFGGFGYVSGFIEGFLAASLASIFWTEEKA